MGWLELAAGATVAIAIMTIPGLTLARIAGMRGIWMWGLAAPFSVTVISLAALAGPFVGMRWGLLPWASVWLALLVIVGGLRFIARPEVPRGRRWQRWTLLAVALGFSAAALQLLVVWRSPDAFSQSFDNIFHMNAIRYALETGSASPLTLGSMTSPGGGVWFYPSAWHAAASLVAGVTGASVPVAANAVVFATSCVAWPTGSVLLTRLLFGRRPVLLVAAGALGSTIPAFPLGLVDYGVLYPYHLGLALLPAAAAATLSVVGLGVSRERGPRGWFGAVLVLGALPALAIAHPGALMAWLVLAALAVVVTFVKLVRSRPPRRSLVLASAGTLAFAVPAAAAWHLLKPPAEARTWLPELTPAQAVGEATLLSLGGTVIPLAATILAIVGVSESLRRRTPTRAWALLALAATLALFVVAYALPYIPLRDFLTGSWYNNWPRLAAIVPVVAVPMVAFGADTAWRRARRMLSRSRGVSARKAIAVLALGLATTTAFAQWFAFADARRIHHDMYAITADSALISTDEAALLARLPEEVPADASIAGNAWTGTALAFALSDRSVVMTHTLVTLDADAQLIMDRLRYAAPGTAVCAAIAREQVEYVLDFGDQEIHDGRHILPGVENLETSPAVRLVDEEGDARLFEVVGCDR